MIRLSWKPFVAALGLPVLRGQMSTDIRNFGMTNATFFFAFVFHGAADFCRFLVTRAGDGRMLSFVDEPLLTTFFRFPVIPRQMKSDSLDFFMTH